MRNPERIHEILEQLRSLWMEFPDQRLGQLLENYVFTNGQRGDRTSCLLFFQEDDDTKKILNKLLKKR